MVAPFMPDDEKLAAVREALPAVGAGIYLNTPMAGPLPAETARSMADLAAWELTTGRASRDRLDEALSRVDEARAAVAAILTADVDAVVLTHGFDDAFTRVASMIAWRDGDQVLGIGHLSGGSAGAVPAGIQAVGLGFVAGDEASAVMTALDRALEPRTRVVVCPHVDVATGTRLPIADIASLAHERGALLLVDGSQAAGAIPVAWDELGADFYALPGSTWLLGPEGIGALAAAERHRDALRLVGHGAGTLASRVGSESRPFEFHLPSVVGFGRGCGWLSMYVGLDWIHRRGAELARAVADSLASIDRVEVLTPRELLATIVTFRVRGWPSPLLVDELGARVFAIASAIPSIDAVRIGVGFFNTADEIDRFAGTVRLLAAHTPATVPPRRGLTVLGGAS